MALCKLKGVAPGELLLATDFDGALALPARGPDSPRALPANLKLLDSLVELGVEVAVISWRAREDLRLSLPVTVTRIVGECLGLKARSPGASMSGPLLKPRVVALAGLIARLEPKAVIYAGDELTDQDVFELLRQLPQTHLGIDVGVREPDTACLGSCDLMVDGPQGMSGFLYRLVELLAARS